MKAIIENGNTYKVTGERGAFTICEDSKGKCKMFQTSIVSIVEIEEMPKMKTYKNNSVKISSRQADDNYKNSKYFNMSKDDFDEMRRKDAINSISW